MVVCAGHNAAGASFGKRADEGCVSERARYEEEVYRSLEIPSIPHSRTWTSDVYDATDGGWLYNRGRRRRRRRSHSFFSPVAFVFFDPSSTRQLFHMSNFFSFFFLTNILRYAHTLVSLYARHDFRINILFPIASNWKIESYTLAHTRIILKDSIKRVNEFFVSIALIAIESNFSKPRRLIYTHPFARSCEVLMSRLMCFAVFKPQNDIGDNTKAVNFRHNDSRAPQAIVVAMRWLFRRTPIRNISLGEGCVYSHIHRLRWRETICFAVESVPGNCLQHSTA